jgi:hypothetical protein
MTLNLNSNLNLRDQVLVLENNEIRFRQVKCHFTFNFKVQENVPQVSMSYLLCIEKISNQ